VSPRIADIRQILNWTMPLRRAVDQVPAGHACQKLTGILPCGERRSPKRDAGGFSPSNCRAQKRIAPLRAALEFARSGDTLVVVEARPLGALDEAVDRNHRETAGEGIGFGSLTEAVDTTTAQGRAVFHMCGALAGTRAQPDSGTHPSVPCRPAAHRRRPSKLTEDDIEAAEAVSSHTVGIKRRENGLLLLRSLRFM